MPIAYGTATDWTNGTGVFTGTSGVSSVTLPADNTRQWVFVENRDVGEVTVSYSGNYANGSTGQMAPLSLNAATQSGYAGGVEQRDCNSFMPARGQVVVTGTAGQKVIVLTA